MRLLVIIPVILLLPVLAVSSLGMDLMLRAVGELSPERSLAVQKIKIVLIPLSALATTALGVSLAVAIIRPLRRMVRMVTRRVKRQSQGTPVRTASVNELLELSDAWNSLLREFDNVATHARLVEAPPPVVRPATPRATATGPVEPAGPAPAGDGHTKGGSFFLQEDRTKAKAVKPPARPAPTATPALGAPTPVVRPAPNGERDRVPELVDGLIRDAVSRRASDIHLEPTANGMEVRFRIDGLLRHVTSIPADQRARLVSRIKIMANLDIAEHRLPQDGRIRLHEDQRTIDTRVSTTPSLYGEKVVLRLLDLEAVAIPLSQCGLGAEHLAELHQLIRRPQGVIFVTGPTGSGKTSTIYACLNDIRSETINIVTIEDPIEYEIAGITQIAVHDKIGLSFANCLRSVLRQDPDVILVGEVRDLETARTAMQASVTGHLVVSTLHTNDAVGAITRLLDMEIPPYLIAASLHAVLAQRLVRVLCPDCKVPWDADPATRRVLGVSDAPLTLYRPAGCKRCYGSGVVGRTGIFELLVVTPHLRNLIIAGASEAEIRRAARAARMRSLFEDGVVKVLDGRVASEEILRVAEPVEADERRD